MADDQLPKYRSPANVIVPALPMAIVIADFSIVSPTTLMPVEADVSVPGDYSKLPLYVDPAGVQGPANPVAILLGDGSFVGPGNPLPTTGGGGGPVTAEQVSVTNEGFDNAQQIFDFLLYVPLNITAFTGGSTNEIGSTVNTVNLAWSYNKDVTSQSINQGIGTLANDVRAFPLTGLGLTTNRTWTLSASDGTTPDSANTSVTFLPKAYWGPWPDQAPDDADILTLTQALASSRGRSVTYDCTGGRFPIYCYPTSFGALTGVTVGGLAFSDYTLDTISLTNAQGYTQDYYLFYFNGIQTGAAINVVFT